LKFPATKRIEASLPYNLRHRPSTANASSTSQINPTRAPRICPNDNLTQSIQAITASQAPERGRSAPRLHATSRLQAIKLSWAFATAAGCRARPAHLPPTPHTQMPAQDLGVQRATDANRRNPKPRRSCLIPTDRGPRRPKRQAPSCSRCGPAATEAAPKAPKKAPKAKNDACPPPLRRAEERREPLARSERRRLIRSRSSRPRAKMCTVASPTSWLRSQHYRHHHRHTGSAIGGRAPEVRFKGSRKSTAYASQMFAQDACRQRGTALKKSKFASRAPAPVANPHPRHPAVVLEISIINGRDPGAAQAAASLPSNARV